MHHTRVSSRLGRLVRRLAFGVTAASLVTAVLPIAGSDAAAVRPLFEQVGTLDRFPEDARAAVGAELVPTFDKATVPTKNKSGTLIMLPKVRRLLQVYTNDANTKAAIVVRNLDSLKIVRTATFNVAFDRATANPTEGGGWSYAVDDTGGRVFLLATGGTHVYDIDTATLAFKTWPLPAATLGFTFPFIVAGMTYDAFDRKLVLMFGGPPSGSVANVNTLLYRMDVSGTPPTAFPPGDLAKIYRVRSCTAPVSSVDLGGETLNWDILVSREFFYVPCQRAGHTVVVVRLTRPDGSNPNHPEDVAAGPVYGETVMADQAGRRLFVTTTRREIWAFESETMSFIGVVATGPQETQAHTGYGLDNETGRVYFQSPTFGLGVVEGRFFPLPQARTASHIRATGQEQIFSDAATNRVFVLDGDGFTISKKAAYKIYATDTAPVPPPKPDPDRNTTDTAEKEGVTEPRWNASGSGYGSRVLLAKGVATVAPAPTVGVNAPTADAFLTANLKCSFTDRDLFGGRVAKAEYDTGSTAAQAVAVDIDNATRQDLNQTSRCDLPAPFDRSNWTALPAACSAGAGTPIQEPAGGEPNLGTATVTCSEPGGKLEAQAESKVSGLVNVDRSYTKTTVLRLPEGGVRSTVESVAQGVSMDIAGVGLIAIGEIRSKAVSSSNGRPQRRAMSTHDIAIEHVRVGDDLMCTTSCDPEQLEEDLNTLAGSRAVFRTGKGATSGRDETLVEGSPRGAQTAVQKSVSRQASDRALVGDFTVEVPAFEMTVFNDNTRWGRARQLYQFAGVATSATYNIVLRPTFLPFDDANAPAGEAGIVDVGNTPFTGLVEGIDQGGDLDVGLTLPTERTALERETATDSGLAGVLRAVGRGIRLFFSDPRHALLLLTAWALLGSPAVLGRRRRLLADIRR